MEELQQLTFCLTALPGILYCTSDKAYLFFDTLKKKERFEWTAKCEEAFTKVKNFLTSPRSHSPEGRFIITSLSPITYQAMSSAIGQEIDRVKKLVYFVSKVFKDVEARCHKIDKLALARHGKKNGSGWTRPPLPRI